jgi:hypothetical protein
LPTFLRFWISLKAVSAITALILVSEVGSILKSLLKKAFYLILSESE